jgi:pyruvate kinase
MLNKGPYMVSAVRVLDDILRRMQAHQAKKRSMLRELHLAHALPAEPDAATDPGRDSGSARHDGLAGGPAV